VEVFPVIGYVATTGFLAVLNPVLDVEYSVILWRKSETNRLIEEEEEEEWHSRPRAGRGIDRGAEARACAVSLDWYACGCTLRGPQSGRLNVRITHSRWSELSKSRVRSTENENACSRRSERAGSRVRSIENENVPGIRVSSTLDWERVITPGDRSCRKEHHSCSEYPADYFRMRTLTPGNRIGSWESSTLDGDWEHSYLENCGWITRRFGL